MPASNPLREEFTRPPPARPTASHGVDIASQWVDELDLEALRFVVSPKMPKRVALDLGCGVGTQGIRFAVLGCRSFLYDLVDIRERIERIRQALDIQHLEFRLLDLRQATPEDFPAAAGVAYSQRFIHYLRFEEASRLLALLASRLCPGARLFISASGLGSELGRGYAHAQHSVEHRFAHLAADMQAKHDVREPVCLYTKEELERLVVGHGFSAIRTWTSPFGNVKGVFERECSALP
jgi:SAM-dependent methyltransferase